MQFVLCTNSSFNLVENQQFVDLMSYVSFDQAEMPTAKILKTNMEKQYFEAKDKLIQMIDDAKYLCLTADLWSKNGRSYMGITGHLYDANLKRVSFLLSFRRMLGRHIHSAIERMISEVINEFKIKKSKITHIITDGAKNFAKAFEVDQVSETDSENEQEERESEFLDEEVDLNFDFHSLSPEEYQSYGIVSENLDLRTDLDEDDEDIEEFSNALPKQLRCVAHTLNLIGGDFEKSLKLKHRLEYNMFKDAFTKLKKFLNLCSRSCIAREIVEKICNRTFPKPNKTRWNSKFDSINVAEAHKQNINKAIDAINLEARQNDNKYKNKARLKKISTIDWKIMKDYCTCMRPVALALDILQGEDRACQGYILPVLYEINAALDDVLRDGFASEYGSKFHEVLVSSLDSRFKDMMRIGNQNKDLILAAAIHPNFKLSWIQNENDKEYAQNLLINECIEMASSSKRLPTEEANTPNAATAGLNESGFFRHLRENETQRRSSSDDSTTLDVYKYILQGPAEPSISEFNRSPLLERVFRRYNTTLCSSAPVERIFSKALLIFTPRRNRLSDVNFERALFIYQNRFLFKNV